MSLQLLLYKIFIINEIVLNYITMLLKYYIILWKIFFWTFSNVNTPIFWYSLRLFYTAFFSHSLIFI